ncbi:hypothetical protein [Burkholderia ubonensis]|uniref:hypothetical protein n=1 Tax=Burkholderia ubonensis TaxID=101571 RepID=UPI0010542E9B|nr:hypothetical protein [Burkholderia ubonensis]
MPAITRAGITFVPGQFSLNSAKFVRGQDALRQVSVQFARQAAAVVTRRALAARDPAVLLNDTQANEP